MKHRRRPSPAFVIACLALVLSMTGTAVAAKTLITSSSQVKTGVLDGTDIKNGSLTSSDIKAGTLTAKQLSAGTVKAFSRAASTGTASGGAPQALSAKQSGSVTANGDAEATVASLDLPAGAYVISAKATLTSTAAPDNSVLTELVRNNKTAVGSCALVVPGGPNDQSFGAVASPYSQYPVTISTQLVRATASAITAKLNCKTTSVPWSAGDGQIIAVKVTA